MEKVIEKQASGVDRAVDEACEELGVARDKVEVEVLQKGGLFTKAKVRVTYRQNSADSLAEFFNGTLERMGLASRATVEDKEGALCVTIAGPDSAQAIGYRGEALDAFQYLALTYLNEHKLDFKKVVVDSENYRAKREQTLTALANRLADKAVRLSRKIALEPMNPFERRIIHSALAQNEAVSTESEGEEPQRHVVITPVGVELKNKVPLKCGEATHGDRRDRNSDRRDRKDGRGRRNSSDRRERRSTPRTEEPEAPDGNVYLGYYTSDDGFKKPAPQAGPPKFKSFGGKKRF